MTSEELAQMTDEEKRIRIAELCGWWWDEREELFRRDNQRAVLGSVIGGNGHDFISLPDYLNDLNAMAEAERNRELRARGYSFTYLPNLMAVIRQAHNGFTKADELSNSEWLACCIFATARQRADAFMLTLS